MKKVLLIFFIFINIGCQQKKMATTDFCIQQNCYTVEIAKTSLEKQVGLMNRKTLPQNEGMLFVYDQEKTISFWMKNTLIPLDIIWFNNNKEIVDIKKQAQPCINNQPCLVITPNNEAKYVLELNAGEAEKNKMKIGDQINFSL